MKHISESHKKARVFTSNGEDSALNAMKMALDSLGDEIQSAKCVIVHYACNEKYPLSWLGSANALLHEQLCKDALCRFGWSWDNSLEPLQIEVALMLTDDCDKAEQMLELLLKSCKYSQSRDIFGESSDNDSYKQRAKEIMRQSGKVSISYLQRTLGVGFGKATSIIKSLEKEGFLSAPNSNGIREILG